MGVGWGFWLCFLGVRDGGWRVGKGRREVVVDRKGTSHGRDYIDILPEVRGGEGRRQGT